MDTKIQNWLKKYDRERFANWKQGEYSKVILCTFEAWQEGKYQAGLHKAPGVKVERIYSEDGTNSSLTLYILTTEEYEKISKQKKVLADHYISKELTTWKARFEDGRGKSKEPQWYLEKEIGRVTKALEDPSLYFFNSGTGLQLAMGAKYSETSERHHPDHHGQTFQNEIAYYHYYTWLEPREKVNYWDSLNLSRYQEWQEFGRQFNTVSMGCNARILAQYRAYLREQAEGKPRKAEPEPLPAFEDLFFNQANADKVRGLMPIEAKYWQSICFAMAVVAKDKGMTRPRYIEQQIARVLGLKFYGQEYPEKFPAYKYRTTHTYRDSKIAFDDKL